jgi:predicted NBD/HSP70 family sugar kinase
MAVVRLLNDDLVVEVAPKGSSQHPSPLGVPLTLNPGAAGAIGVDFAHQALRVVVADIAHNVLAEEARELPLDYDAREVMDLAAAIVIALIERTGLDRSRILGVGVGVPGPVDQRCGCPTPSSISSSWVGLQVAEEFHERVQLPVLVDNNGNLGALAEVVWGAAKDFANVIYVKVGTGVGGGIILDGRPWRGAVGAGGEIGHMTLDQNGPMCRCGNRGCLEVYVGVSAQLALLGPVFGSEFNEERLLELAIAGDRRCRRMFADVGRDLGKALASMCNVINPEAVVLGGELASVFDLVESSVRNAIDLYALHLAAQSVVIIPGLLGSRAEALGGVALIFHEEAILWSPTEQKVHGVAAHAMPAESSMKLHRRAAAGEES